MNCPSCKNPIQNGSVECEWCGIQICLNSSNNNFDSQYIINFHLKTNPKYTNPRSILIFVDNLMVKEFSINEGCDFDYLTSNIKPEISVSLNGGKKLYKLPNIGFDSKNTKYRIEWRPNWLNVFYFNKPAIFKTI